MPCGKVTQRTWAESQGQRYLINVPGLLRVWRVESGSNSRRPRASPCADRLPLRSGQGENLDDSYGHQHSNRPRRRPTNSPPEGSYARQNLDRYERQPYSPLEDSHARQNRDRHERGPHQPVNRPSAFDSWDRLSDSFLFEEEVDENLHDQPYNAQPRDEVRRPARAIDETRGSNHADEEPRSRERRPHREDGRYAASESSRDGNALRPSPRQGSTHRGRYDW